MNTPDTDNPTPYDLATGGGYLAARLALGLTQVQLALITQKSLTTIKHREGGRIAIPYEAQATMRWLLANPPKVPSRSETRLHTKGETFGLFKILLVAFNEMKRPAAYWVRCRCGEEKYLKAGKLLPGTLCRPYCPAYAAMVERGSQVDANGDIIDKDGFPES
jgi:hypothetical protein